MLKVHVPYIHRMNSLGYDFFQYGCRQQGSEKYKETFHMRESQSVIENLDKKYIHFVFIIIVYIFNILICIVE